MATNINNAALDAQLAAVTAAENGPWTRVGTSTDLNTPPYARPNSDIEYHVKTADGFDVYISYDQIVDPLRRRAKFREAIGTRAVLKDLKDLVTFLTDALDAVNIYTVEEQAYTMYFRAFQAMRSLAAMIPHDAWIEVQGNQGVVNASFVAGAPAGNDVQFTDNSTGAETWRLWDFGDNTISQRDDTPFTHTFPGPGVYEVTLTIIGPYGMDQQATNVTIV